MGHSYADISAGPSNYPERKPHVPDTEFIVGLLLGLLFLFGVLILLVLGAKQPPPFAQLTVFRCDPPTGPLFFRAAATTT